MKKPLKATESATPQAAALRRKAEEALQKRHADRSAGMPEDTRRLLHELEVHQIELQMQNDELSRRQLELDASRARYFDLYDLAPVGYLTISDKGLIIEANLTAATLLGVSRTSLRKQPLSRYIAGDDAVIYSLHRKKVLETGEPQSCIIRMLKKDGSFFWARLEATAEQDADRPPVCRVVVVDITRTKQDEEALRSSEYRQKAILNIIPDIAWIKDLEGKYIAVNEAFAQAAGCDNAAIAGKTDRDLWPAELAAQYCKDDLQVMQSGHRIVCEEQMISEGGSAILLESIKTPLYDGKGNLIGTAGIARDITERVKMAEMLRISSQKWRDTFDAMIDPIALLSIDGVVEQCNRAFIDFLALDFPAVLGQKCHQLIHRTKSPIEDCPIVKARVSGVRETIEFQSGDKIFLVAADPIKDHDGKITGFVHIMRDITKRKQAEERLRELNIAVQQSRDGIALADWDGYIRIVNASWARMHGYCADELIGRHLNIFHTPEQLETDVIPFNKHALENGSQEGEVGHVRKDGTTFPTWMSSTVVKFEGQKPSGWLGIARDITDSKEAEQALQAKNAELERFTYSVSHDLRSPLVTIRTFTGHLVQDMAQGDTELVAQDFAYINGASEKMVELLDELLKLSRIGRVINPCVEAPLQDIVSEALIMVAGRIDERAARVTVTGKPVLLYGDRVRLVEVFQNLVENAVKFMGEQKEPMVEIGAEKKNGDIVCFVRDNGMGIDPRHRDKLFSLFEKLNSGLEGNGIGLYLVKRIIEVHGGRIWAESEGIGKGACFWFSLPGKQVQG